MVRVQRPCLEGSWTVCLITGPAYSLKAIEVYAKVFGYPVGNLFNRLHTVAVDVFVRLNRNSFEDVTVLAVDVEKTSLSQ